LWKNIAQSENKAEIRGVFANVKKIFWRRGKKIFERIRKTGSQPALLSALNAGGAMVV
jgi:hypothetical protein